jgi:hypothetical protein
MEMISRSWHKCYLEKWNVVLNQIGIWRGLGIGCVRKKTWLVVIALKRGVVCILCTFIEGITSVVGLSKTIEVRISLDTVIHWSNVRGVVAHLKESRRHVDRQTTYSWWWRGSDTPSVVLRKVSSIEGGQ